MTEKVEIRSIYERFSVPPNLQGHMLRVAAVAEIVAGRCKEATIDLAELTAACLLHDLGNIVKFDMEKYPQYLGAEIARKSHWKNVQRDMIERYGADDHEATAKMLEEAGVPVPIQELIGYKSFPNAIKIANENDWASKIFLYADLRVAPFGIIPLEERLNELLLRLEKYRGRTDLADAARRIEAQLEKACLPHALVDADLKAVEARIPDLRKFVLQV
jgi:hypothetical protein